MTYNFNPHRHVKIWLSKDKDTFLNLENRIRLVTMRDINPRDDIYFIYDSQLLSENALKEMKSFCTKYKIIAKDVRKDVIPSSHSKEEKNLVAIYEDEISHLEEGGNLAVGSDILRWLKPVYELGTYTDFDVHVDTRELPETISVEKPLLISLGSFAIKDDVEVVFLNTDTIAVVDSKEALSDIQKIQRTIYNHCSMQPPYGLNFFHRLISTAENRLRELFSPFWANILLKLDPNFKLLPILGEHSKGKTAREVRQNIINLYTTNNYLYGVYILAANKRNYSCYDESQTIAEAANLERAAVKQQLGWLNWLYMSKAQYKQIEAIAAIQDDQELLNRSREQYRMVLLKNSVINTSGPVALLSALFKEFYYEKEMVNKELMPFSFAYYRLDKAFVSQNSIPLHATKKAVSPLMQNTEVGKTNDLSWLEEGRNATACREQKIRETQARLPQDFHEMREKIETHIKKIQADLEGCFGFYRYRERHAKIDALKNIIKHFEEQSFDVSAFNTALSNYRSKDISASIGKSKTKELIDQLELFGQLAKRYMLTDEHGKVAILPPTIITSPSLK